MHRFVVQLAVLATVFILPCSAIAQEDSQDLVVQAAGDRFPIHITYFPALESAVSGGLSNAPVVVLLHGEKESRLIWNKGSSPRGVNPFPVELQKRGYAVITVDLRKHGESIVEGQKDDVRPDDYGKMILGDMKGVKDFIQEEHQKRKLNMRKMGIVASGFSAPIAAAFAEFDWRQVPYDDAPIPAQRTPRGQDVRVLILVSPDAGAGRARTSKSVGYLKSPKMGVSLQVVVGEEDKTSYRAARSIYQNFTTIKDNDQRAEFVTPKVKDAGIALLRLPVGAAYLPMLKFLDEQLKKRDDPWADRRSRLER
ncbi:alpha/beta hydrolase family protein [Thalassoglobus polymorphus]|uniref:Alpha/beta hydrolase family protein n=1 Tax=Thalassoglobus polymorphus TaxID=2527994 RepID=A0A517QUR8_9PLAN|nr:alpha/beta hydrolase [Thalassoglobus polymorphus]QDT35375.1 Alpha/beta hydrolase family protein [Thalassoglobus polymorphus]